jgi:hypothetical protein
VITGWTGLAPWDFELPFPGSLTSTFLALHLPFKYQLLRRGASQQLTHQVCSWYRSGAVASSPWYKSCPVWSTVSTLARKSSSILEKKTSLNATQQLTNQVVPGTNPARSRPHPGTNAFHFESTLSTAAPRYRASESLFRGWPPPSSVSTRAASGDHGRRGGVAGGDHAPPCLSRSLFNIISRQSSIRLCVCAPW